MCRVFRTGKIRTTFLFFLQLQLITWRLMQSSAVAPLPCMDVVVGHLPDGLLKSDGAAFGLSLISGRYRIPGGEMPLSKSLRTLRMFIGSYVAATRVQAHWLQEGVATQSRRWHPMSTGRLPHPGSDLCHALI